MKKLWMLLFGIWANLAWSQGFILPHHGFTQPELTDHSFAAELYEQTAEIRVSQTFYNPAANSMEGVYYFPIPKEAIVNQFALWVDGKKLAGELLDSGQARAIYEEIVRRQVDPALLEYSDHRFFRLSMFPLPGHGRRKIELTYSQVLTAQGGMVRFLYPVHGDLQAGRGAPPIHVRPLTRHHDHHDEIVEKLQGSCRQNFKVHLKSAAAIGSIYSPSHKIEIDRISDQEARISYEGNRRSEENDFLLYYALSDDAMAMNLICHRTDDKPGYFMLLISPKSSWAEGRILNKDVVFVLDTSGSMTGEKMTQAKAALAYCLNSLHDQDRFALITFSSEVQSWKAQWITAADGRKSALEHVRDLEAKGGTNIDGALATSANLKPGVGRTGSVVFITDGLPTVGVQDVKTILAHVAAKKTPSRIFTFGVGNDVNTWLLDKVAETSRAVADYIAPDENIEEKISGFFDKVSKPVLTDLTLELTRISVRDRYPQDLPDLFQNDQLLLVGRYTTSGETDITLKGTARNAAQRFSYNGRFPQRAENEFLPRLWASRKIAWLVDEMRTHGENEEVKKEIESLSKEYGVMSPYTAFLAQEDEKRDMALSRAPLLNWSGASHEKRSQAPMAAAQSVGGVAVSVSKRLREMKEEAVLDSDHQIRYAGDKAFAWQNEEWVETRYNGETCKAVQANSPAFQNLLKYCPQLGRYLALGDRLVFSWKGKYVRISDVGEREWSMEQWRGFFGN